jgi:hypothetical protein
MIEFKKLSKGDTLIVVGNPHFKHHGSDVVIPVKAEVQVVEVMPAGVKVQDTDGNEAVFAFQHGAEKLEYTPDTEEAIRKREAFAKKSEKAESGKSETPKAAIDPEIEIIEELKDYTKAELGRAIAEAKKVDAKSPDYAEALVVIKVALGLMPAAAE